MAPFNHQVGKSYSRPFLVPALEAVQKPAAWRRLLRALELEPEDLLAIPLCLLIGFGFAVYSLGTDGLMMAMHRVAFGGNGEPETVAKVVALFSGPACAVRQLFS